MRPHIVWRALLAASLLAYDCFAAEPAPKLTPGSAFTLTFPEMPPTFYDMYAQKDVKAQMTVCRATTTLAGNTRCSSS
jgi:hypothetical protein